MLEMLAVAFIGWASMVAIAVIGTIKIKMFWRVYTWKEN